MSPEAWKKDLAKLEAVTSAWFAWTDPDSPVGDEAAQLRERFPRIGNGDPSAQIKGYSRHSDKMTWHALDGFFHAAPFPARTRDGQGDDVYWPLVAFELRASLDRLELAIRIALYRTDGGDIDAWGWRFDSADVGRGIHSHPYDHVQHITSWDVHSEAFDIPGRPAPVPMSSGYGYQIRKTIPESKPAIPVRSTSAAGLVVAAIISLYGAQRAAGILQSAPQLDDQFHSLTGHHRTALL